MPPLVKTLGLWLVLGSVGLLPAQTLPEPAAAPPDHHPVVRQPAWGHAAPYPRPDAPQED